MATDEIKSPGCLRQTGGEVGTLHLSADVYRDADGAWQLPATEGFSVHVSGRGYIVLEQGYPDAQTIVLHPAESQALRGVLMEAEQLATKRRNG